MKKIFILSALVLSLFSCEHDDIIYKGGDFVQFNDAEANEILALEHRGFAKVTLSLSKVSSSDLTVNFSYQDNTALAGVHYDQVPSIVIPAGQSSVELSIPVHDDNLLNDDRFFDVTIASVSDPNYRAGLGQLSTVTKTIKIANEDLNCTSNTSYTYWLGNVNVEDVGYSTTTGTVSLIDCDVIKLNADIIGVGIKADYAITFIPSASDRTIGTVNLPVTLTGYSNAQYKFGVRAIGTYNSNTGLLVLNYQATAHDLTTGDFLGNFTDFAGQSIITLR